MSKGKITHTTVYDTTKQGMPIAMLKKDGDIMLKAYPNEAGTKIRIVIPSLKSFKQTLVNIDQHYIEVDL